MKRLLIRNVIMFFILATFAMVLFFARKTVVSAATHSEGETIYSDWGYAAGEYDAKGRIVFHPCTEEYEGYSCAHVNSNALQYLCSLDGEKTIVIPSGSSVELMYSIYVNGNTTIIANGAEIYAEKGILYNLVSAANFQSISHVTIQGGTWRTTSTATHTSILRFLHGNDVTIKNATIIANYQAHCIEFVAMKNCTVENCTLKVQGTQSSTSTVEAIQMDIATETTSPGISTEQEIDGVIYGGAKYANGQGCKNIKILNNTIRASRGICANFTNQEGTAMRNQFHENITISGNTIVGVSAEGCVLYNTLNAVITNNNIKTLSTRTSTSYASGLKIIIRGTATSVQCSSATLKIRNNIIYGYKKGIIVRSMSSSRYRKIVLRKNTCYATRRKDALVVKGNAVRNLKSVNNKLIKRV